MRAALLSSALLAAACGWWGDDRAAISRYLDGCKELVNAPASEGLATLTRAAEIGGCFTEDVRVDLGGGTAPISGRQTLMGMISRLQSRTADYRLEFADVQVQLAPDEQSADVDLTAEFIRREPETRQTRDAREFKLTMRREDGGWRIAQVAAVQTLR